MAWPLITADSHHNVPLDLVDELPAKYRQYLPRIEQREDGAYLVRPASQRPLSVRRTAKRPIRCWTR